MIISLYVINCLVALKIFEINEYNKKLRPKSNHHTVSCPRAPNRVIYMFSLSHRSCWSRDRARRRCLLGQATRESQPRKGSGGFSCLIWVFVSEEQANIYRWECSIKVGLWQPVFLQCQPCCHNFTLVAGHISITDGHCVYRRERTTDLERKWDVWSGRRRVEIYR